VFHGDEGLENGDRRGVCGVGEANMRRRTF
jgi:hypothetical protein